MTMLEDLGLQRAVHDQGSAIEDASPDHGITLDGKEEGGRRIGNEAVIQVQRLLLVVLGRGRKAGLAREISCRYRWDAEAAGDWEWPGETRRSVLLLSWLDALRNGSR